jgi:hypothetical protein
MAGHQPENGEDAEIGNGLKLRMREGTEDVEGYAEEDGKTLLQQRSCRGVSRARDP